MIAFVLGGIATALFSPAGLSFPFSTLGDSKGKVCDYVIQRIDERALVKPMLSAEPACESDRFNPLKKQVVQQIAALKQAGHLEEASVYLRDFQQGEWMAISDELSFHPASLLKVPLMMAHLRKIEGQPNALLHELALEPGSLANVKPQHYISQQIEPGKPYTLHDLLIHMIAHSDNRATKVLAAQQNYEEIKRLFLALGLETPPMNEQDYLMTARQYSVFFKALYNSSYLSPEYSQYAAEILSNCAFKEGFAKGMPENTKMWHKFGEWEQDNRRFELHESGIVYVKNQPFLLTIMTRGNSREGLTTAMQSLAKNIHGVLAGP